MFISPAVENMVLGMDKEVWETADSLRDIVHTQGEWELLGINKANLKMSVGSSLFDQIIFYVNPEILAWLPIPWSLHHGTLLSPRASCFLPQNQKGPEHHNPHMHSSLLSPSKQPPF